MLVDMCENSEEEEAEEEKTEQASQVYKELLPEDPGLWPEKPTGQQRI